MTQTPVALVLALATLSLEAEAKEPNLNAEVKVAISASAEQIHPFVSDLSTWPNWTTWSAESDPSLSWEFEGEAGTAGHSMYWDGKKLGRGRLTLTESTEEGIKYHLWFGGKAKESRGDPSTGTISYLDMDGQTQVIWTDQMHIGFPGSLFAKKIEAMVEADFEGGLRGLKPLAEAVAAQQAEAALQAAKEAEEAARAAAAAAVLEAEGGE